MKLSIAFQIRRITVPNTKSRKAINIILVLSVITGVFLVGIQTFQCIPVQNAWKLVPPGQPKPGCSSVRISGYTPNIINIVMDFIIWIVPLPLLAKLKLPKLQKIILMMVFSVGAV